MIGWGDPTDPMEASPMVLCPPIIPAEIVDLFCATLVEKDPEGKLGQEMEKFIEAEIKAEEASPEMQGVLGEVPGPLFDMEEGDTTG
jgi:hypothetical protein